MHQPHLPRPLPHPGHEAHQAGLVRMSRIAAQGLDAGADGNAFPVEVNVAATRAVLLDRLARRALGLVADEQHVVPRIAEHGLEVVEDATAGAHAAGGDDDGRAGSLGEVADHREVLVVAVDGDEVGERQRVAAALQALAGLGVPEGLEVPVGLGEAAGER